MRDYNSLSAGELVTISFVSLVCLLEIFFDMMNNFVDFETANKFMAIAKVIDYRHLMD